MLKTTPPSARLRPYLLALSGVTLFVLVWDAAIRLGFSPLLPGPLAVARAIVELASKGFLFRHVVASLYRVTWGYLLAVSVGIPLGIALARYRRAGLAFGPIVEILRPISALAWIPLAILWFGVGDLSSVFIIFLASLLPLVVATVHAVNGVSETHWNAGRNFGLGPTDLARKVLYPAIVPQLLVGLRLSLGIAWLVVVAAEMIAVNSGLGFLIIDARNAGNRYDLVVAGMVSIGVIGLGLDALMRRFERARSVAWGFSGSNGNRA